MKRLPLFLLLSSLSWVGVAPANPTSIEVFAKEAKQTVKDSEVKVPLNISSIRFAVKPQGLRFRYKLEGVDEGWQEKTDTMNFMVRFIDGSGNQIQQLTFPSVGISEGWTGSVNTSGFTTRQERIVIPPKADYVGLALSSSGPVSAVGVIAARNISITSVPENGATARQFLVDSRLPGSKEQIWSKSGSHPSMAKFLHWEKDSRESSVLYIEDDDVQGHADLVTVANKMIQVIPGERLEVEWEEAHSIGLAGGKNLDYAGLPAGKYQFLVEDLSVMGVPLGKINRIQVVVSGPIWGKWWFWLGGLSFIALCGGLWGRSVIRRNIKRHLRHAQLIADERLRIARDLHDDLGTRLSHISLIGAHAQADVEDENARASFNQITELSAELVGALSETVWMLNSNNNNLESLVDFLCRLVSELCRLAKIRCRIDAMQVTEDRKISHDFRHNFSLSVKESINNALKHSNCTEIQLRIWKENSTLKISVADDGVGLQDERRKDGTGLASIQQRMDSIGGTCLIEGVEPCGVRVLLIAPLK